MDEVNGDDPAKARDAIRMLARMLFGERVAKTGRMVVANKDFAKVLTEAVDAYQGLKKPPFHDPERKLRRLYAAMEALTDATEGEQ